MKVTLKKKITVFLEEMPVIIIMSRALKIVLTSMPSRCLRSSLVESLKSLSLASF